jgi:hypothetical protein
MQFGTRLIFFAVLSAGLPAQARGTDADQQTSRKAKKAKHGRSAKSDVAGGAGNVAGGAAKGAGHAAEGVGKGAVDLATLHPLGAAADVGKGGVSAGKDVAVGTTKGTAKVVKGIGKGLKHIL